MAYITDEDRTKLIELFIIGRKKMFGMGEDGEEKKMSVREIADQFGVSHQTVCNIVTKAGMRSGKTNILKKFTDEAIQEMLQVLSDDPDIRPRIFGAKFGMSYERGQRVMQELAKRVNVPTSADGE